MSRALRLFLTFCLLLTLVPVAAAAPPRTARAASAGEVSEIIDGIQSLGVVINSLAGLAGLGEPVPFTDVDPTEILDLDSLITDALNMLGAPATDLVGLAAYIDGRDNTYSGVNVQFNNVVGNDGANTLSFDVAASRSLSVPLKFASGDVNLDGGAGTTLAMTFNLATHLDFAYNGGASNPAEKVYLDNTPVIDFTATASVGDLTALNSLLGFAQVTADGSVVINSLIRATFDDPDDNGDLTMDEWASTALNELVSIAFVDHPAGNDVDGSLTLDAALIPGTPDATVVWQDPNLADGLATPTVTLNALDDFTNINPNMIFGGLANAATALLGAQQNGDLQLPLINERLSDLVRFADPLVDFLHEMGDAAIVCGPNNTEPPSGPIFGLQAGQNVFCRAFTVNPVGTVNWEIGGNPAGGATGTNPATAGPAPTTSVELTLGAGGMDSITLDYQFQGDPTPRLARPIFLTVDELVSELTTLAGINTVTPEYNAAAKTLRFRLQDTLPTITKAVETNFADQLKANTGLFGLTQTGSDVVNVEIQSAVDVSVGVILVADPAAIKTGGTDSDRFFIEVNPAGNEFQADVAITAGSDFGLEGRLAFLKVTAGGIDTAVTPGTEVIALGDSNDAPGAPSLALNLNVGNITGPGLPASIPNARLVSDLIGGDEAVKLTGPGVITAQCEVGMSAGLGVVATIGSNTTLASGSVAVSWPDVFTDGSCVPLVTGPDGLQVTPDAQFISDLKSFEIDTSNPLAMLSIILDAISGFAQAIDTLPALGDLDVQIPIVGVSPRELLDEIEALNTTINDIRSNPTGTLQDLEIQLETELGIADPNLLSFELGDIDTTAGSPEKDLIIRLGYNKGDTLQKPLNFQLNGGGLGIVEAGNTGSIAFAYEAGVQFDVAIPLKNLSALADTRVLPTTQAVAGGSMDAPSLNLTAGVGPLSVGATGVAKADVEVLIKNPSTDPETLADWVTGVTADLTGGPVDCLPIDVDPTAAEDLKDLTGQACAKLDLTLNNASIGTLGFRAEDITAPDDLATHPGWFVYIPDDLATNISSALLNWGLLFDVLPKLVTKLEGLLAQGAEDVSIPGLGEALDAGADVVGAINSSVITPLSGIGAALNGLPTVVDIENAVRTQVLNNVTILLDRTGDDAVDAADVTVQALCDAALTDCADGADPLTIGDLRVTFLIGQEVTEEPAFDIGVPGLPIEVTGATSASVGWQLLLDVGLSRNEGPYIIAAAADEFQLGAEVTLAVNPGGCAANPDQTNFFPSSFSVYSNNRCLEGKLAFLSVGMHDGDTPNGDVNDDPTRIGADTFLDLTSSAPGSKLTAGNIINSVGLEPQIVAETKINLALRTGVDVLDGLPAVLGAFHLNWSFDTDSPSVVPPTVAFDSLYLDAGTFISQILKPIVDEVRKVTSPLEPIVDFIQAEVPVLTQLAELVGEDPVTVLTLIELSAGFDEGDLDLVESVLEIIQLANAIAGMVEPGAGNLFIELGSLGNPGSFSLDGNAILQGGATPDNAQSLISSSDAGTGLINELAGANATTTQTGTERPGTFGVEGLTFPFLDDATQIFGLLLGQDITIVRMDFGTFEASVSEGYEFGPIFIGPFPVTAEVGLAFSASARFAMGYDTRGLREVLGGANVTKLFKGIFIDDLDINGVDVEEWRLTFRVTAEAALDLVIVEAGVYGGVDSILTGNLNDEPNPDGKLYFDEIFDKLSNPICLFDISGKLELFMGFYVEVDLFFWSDRWELELLRVTLLDFTIGCQGEEPKLAEVIGGDLWLNIGDRADERGIQEGEKNEEFTVRQIGTDKFAVEAFGLKQEFSGVTGLIKANALDGDDIIGFVKGGDDDNPIAFTHGSVINLGDHNDSFTGADGVDTVNGGQGADRIIGGKANDVLAGDGEDDRIDGGIGDDTLSAGAGNDLATGGPGADIINGGDGNDSLQGGPYTEVNPDGVDTITGEAGNDNIDGGPANDILNGDEEGLDCTEDGDNTGGNDAILGGPGNDTISGGWGDDFLTGQQDNDKICGNAGKDTIDGDDDDATTADAGDRNDGGFDGGLYGGSGDDTMYGRGGDDQMYGGPDKDTMYGGADNDLVNGDGGDDTMYGEAGIDTMNGGDQNDTMYGGDDGDIMKGDANDDTMYGDGGVDTMNGNTGVDIMRGGADGDIMAGDEGDDEMYGDAGADQMHGNADNDLMRGNGDNDQMWGDAGQDEMYGDAGADFMEGNDDADTMRGNAQDDYMEGNGGVDTINGDEGQDDIIGGSDSADQLDEGDFLFGNAGQDVIAGDNASITRPNVPAENDGTIVRAVTLHDMDTGNNDTGEAGNDAIQGNEQNDDLYGGGEDDTIRGNGGDDLAQGNGGTDNIQGNEGQDDLIGGSSQGAGGQPDEADTIYGGNAGADLLGDFDVIAGDNSLIVRVPTGATYVTDDYAPDTLGVVRRIVTLYDVAEFGGPVVPAIVYGADNLNGEGGFDIMYGQGGDENPMSGGTGNDEMYGNDGADTMLGNDGQDDMVGGTGRRISNDAGSAIDGRLDGADNITGGSGSPAADADDYDAIVGDNATIFRTRAGGDTGYWVFNSFNDAIIRTIRFYDVGVVGDAADAGTSGGDFLYGEDNDDTMYGQGGGDTMEGNLGQDYMEGNADADEMYGNEDNDDMVGGTGRINDDPATGTNGRLDAGDEMYGGSEFDVMAGDNALLVRTLVGGEWVLNTFNDGTQHEPRILLDENSPDALLVSGGDFMRGNEHDDLMYGQAGDDDMDGNAGDDFMEGNSDDDTMAGSEDQDDMIGGTVVADIWDGADIMTGGGAGDVMTGDNATIVRPLTEGEWQIEPNTLDEVRIITLFNVEVVGGPAVDPLRSGSDTMAGNDGADRMFGQGNDDEDSDGDGLANEDPADGIDNDMDGRESAASTQYDCADGFDNDADGQTDGADTGCSVKVDEDGGGDYMEGNAGHDFMEGNHGADLMFGNEDEDDMWGGSSSDATGVVGSGSPPDNLADANDIMRGNAEDDQIIGDNGLINRVVDGGGFWQHHEGPRANGDLSPFDMVKRVVGVTESPELAGAFGNDWMQGGSGEDEEYGQQGNDYMEGNEGEDALLGDLGLITSSTQDGLNEQSIAPPGPFFTEVIYPTGSFYRQFTLFSFTGVPAAAGNDIILGGDDRDSIHGSDGDDFLNGDGDADVIDSMDGDDANPTTADIDKVFGGDGNDVMWGGRDDDNMWGGYGDDNLDVRPRRGIEGFTDDSPLWHTFGRFDFYQGLDLIYGGWDRDAMQANVAAPGPRNTDHLLDWTGGYDVFYVCPGAYGEGTITRQGNPQLMDWMRLVIDADGALNSATLNTSGYRELAYVFPNERGANSNAPHPDHPGHFTCDDGSQEVTSHVMAAPDSMYLSGLTGVHESGNNKNFWTASATVTVYNFNHQPVQGATVVGQWSNDLGHAITCTTDAAGTCSMPDSRNVSTGSLVTLSITNVTHPALYYEPTLNEVSSTVTVAEVPAALELPGATPTAVFLPLITQQ